MFYLFQIKCCLPFKPPLNSCPLQARCLPPSEQGLTVRPRTGVANQVITSGIRRVRPVVLSWGQFCTPLPPPHTPGHLPMLGIISGFHVGACPWHLVGRGQGCCKHPYMHGSAPTTKRGPQPRMAAVPGIEAPGWAPPPTVSSDASVSSCYPGVHSDSFCLLLWS